MTEAMVQFSIFLANKPGLLGNVCRALAAAKINIVALSMMDVSDNGVLRIVARDADAVKEALEPLNLSMRKSKVLAVIMPNRPGALADVCERLSANGIQVSYVYGTTGAAGGKAIGIFKLQNMTKAVKVLAEKRGSGRDMRVKLRNRQRAGGGARSKPAARGSGGRR